MDALRAAVAEMVADFRSFPHLDCGPGDVRDDGVLSWRHDADIESNLPPVDPVSDEDVSGTRAGAGDETGHFLFRVEGCLKHLRLFPILNFGGEVLV